MGHSQASKTASRTRILKEAAACLRTEGVQGLSIAALMQSAGLTHGGFYRHFPSREELVGAALKQALSEGDTNPAHRTDSGEPDLRRLIRSYLSRTHRDAGPAACAISALAAETGRNEALKPVMAPHIESFLSGVASQTQDPARAALITSALVGALTLSRVLPAEQSDALLRQVQEELLGLLEG